MKKYRLKEKAYPYFKKDLQTKVFDLDMWKRDYNVCEEALEEVCPCYITFGIPTSSKGTMLRGWSAPDSENPGARFHFTIHFPSMKCREYDEFSKGNLTRVLMETIQRDVDYWWQQFNVEEE